MSSLKKLYSKTKNSIRTKFINLVSYFFYRDKYLKLKIKVFLTKQSLSFNN